MFTSASTSERIAIRHRLPIKLSAVVEKDMGERRYLISLTDNIGSLQLFQRELNDLFAAYKNTLKKPELDEIEIGKSYLCVIGGTRVYRVRVVNLKEKTVSCLLIDFGLYHVVNSDNFYCISDIEEFEFREASPFVMSVVLPPDAILKSLGLPTSNMILAGDLVDVILLTSVQPHLAVFSFTRSGTYRFLPKNFTDGFSNEETKNWLALFENQPMSYDTLFLSSGYSKLHNRELHTNRLAFIAYVKALDSVFVYDLESMIRLAMLRERLEILYGDEKVRATFAFAGLEQIEVGMGCVVYHKITKAYVRAEILSVGAEQFEVVAVDHPDYGIFTVKKEDIFKVPRSLDFPRLVFKVRMIRDSTTDACMFKFAELSRFAVPSKTVVVLNSEPKFGLTRVSSAIAPNGVLSKIGFVNADLDKFSTRDVVGMKQMTFGEKKDVAFPAVDKFA